MKLSDFKIDEALSDADIASVYAELNDTGIDYPRDATVHALFSRQARETPDAVAVCDADASLTYRELEEESNRLARFLLDRNYGPEFVAGVLQERSVRLALTQLGIMKAGGAYLPVSPEMPYSRIRYIMENAGARLLLFDGSLIREANKLQWECAGLSDIICIDSDDLYGLREETGEMMKEDTWEYLRREMQDDISGGGWRSSFTGELLSREVMDDYASNIEKKLGPLLDSGDRVLEIGCASGMSMFRLAPKVEHYYGTELTGDILEWTAAKAEEKQIDNITLRQLAAHETERIDAPPFDAVIMNSVIQCFSGHNYLRDALRQAIEAMGGEGLIFLGNIWDQELKDAFTDELEQFEREHMGEGYTTKTDRYEELFLSRQWFRDLQYDRPEITGIEFSPLITDHRSELSDYSYDVLLTVDKQAAAGSDDGAAPGPERKSRRQFDRSDYSALPDDALPEQGGADKLANLMYTSGSTGRPKGVQVEHRNITRLVTRTNYIAVTPRDRILQGGTPSFDASTIETWLALLNGAELHYPRQLQMLDTGELSRFLREREITVLFLTTRLFNLLTDRHPEAYRTLRVLMTGGERASTPHFNTVRERCPDLKLMNVYGPTENTGYSTFYPVESRCKGEIPIGRPVANSTVHVLDEKRNRVPRGMAGELYVSGDGVARGYVGRPELTERAFIDNPFGEGRRLYRTGDMVRLNADRQLEYIGRRDDQLKIRGNRVEPGEVEHLLLGFPQISRAVVLPVERENETVLGAYLVASGNIDLEVVREHLRRKLPEQMIPSHFQRVDALPLNASGKLDRSKLPGFENGAANAQTPPSGETESALLKIWREILDREAIGVDENFFDIGGHSLSTTRLVSAIDKEMGISLPLTLIFTANTIREQAAYIDNLESIDNRILHDDMAPLAAGENGVSLFGFPPGSGYALAYAKLAPLLHPFGFCGFPFLEKEHRLRRYVDLITRTQSPPYILFGYSGGGKLAFVVAQELERQGHEVERIVMVDSARYLREVPVTDADVRYYAEEFLEGITSRVLRQRVARKMKAYRRYLARLIETGTVEAEIHVIRGEDAEDLYYGPDGEPWATLSGWEENTTGAFQLIEGHGTHKEMLNEPNLSPNAGLIRKCLTRS